MNSEPVRWDVNEFTKKFGVATENNGRSLFSPLHFCCVTGTAHVLKSESSVVYKQLLGRFRGHLTYLLTEDKAFV